MKNCIICNSSFENYLECLGVFDEGSVGDFAFNMYICNKCGSIYKEDVWKNKGVLVIDKLNKIVNLKEW